MSSTRRDFLRASAVTAGALATGLHTARAAEPRAIDLLAPRPERRPAAGSAPLDILVLGGTSFIGPYQVQYALDRGHNVTLFNRGKTNTQLFPQVEKLHGDRAVNDLESLKGRKWDAVIDNSASNPDWVRDSAQLLRDHARTYLFVSTRSVYRDLSAVPATKDAPVYTRETTKFDPTKPLPYGLAKAESEKQLRAAFGERSLVLRPGLIIGPGDDTDRFSYWPVRIDRGGEILAPGDGSDPVQIIDARDLGEWCIRLLEQGTHGTFNAIGPKRGRSFTEFLYGIAAVTAEETLEYPRSRPAARQAVLHAGLTPERELEVLAAWKARK
jgi:2'-hydroxyisoflavone reductase